MMSERVSPILARCEKSCTLSTILDAGRVAAAHAEGQHGARALRHVALGEVVVAVARQPGVADPGHLVVLRKPLRDRERVVGMALHAKRQRLDAGDEEEGVEGRDRRPEIAQAEHAAGDGESKVPERLVQLHAVIFGPRLGEQRIAAASADQLNVPPSTMTPPIELPWPPMNLVSEWTTMSAPCSNGRQR